MSENVAQWNFSRCQEKIKGPSCTGNSWALPSWCLPAARPARPTVLLQDKPHKDDGPPATAPRAGLRPKAEPPGAGPLNHKLWARRLQQSVFNRSSENSMHTPCLRTTALVKAHIRCPGTASPSAPWACRRYGTKAGKKCPMSEEWRGKLEHSHGSLL